MKKFRVTLTCSEDKDSEGLDFFLKYEKEINLELYDLIYSLLCRDKNITS